MSSNSSPKACIQPDSDVAGIGVVVAYSIHTVLIIVLCLVHFYCALRLGRENLENYPDDYPQIIAVGKLLVDLVDTQPVLALALVVGAYTKTSPTSAYHLRMVQYIVNLNTLSVLLALGFTARLIRLSWYRILSLTALVIAWVVPQAKGTWSDSQSIISEAACFGSKANKDWMLGEKLDQSELQFGAIMCAFEVFFVILLWITLSHRSRHSNDEVNNTGSTQNRRGFLGCLGNAFKVFFYCLMFGLAIVAIVLVGKTIGAIVFLRKIFTPYTGHEENEWGYGQVLAMALLIQPLVEFTAACVQGIRKVLNSKTLKEFELESKKHKRGRGDVLAM